MSCICYSGPLFLHYHQAHLTFDIVWDFYAAGCKVRGAVESRWLLMDYGILYPTKFDVKASTIIEESYYSTVILSNRTQEH